MTTENDQDSRSAKIRYYIDMDWYKEQERSFLLLATSRLCPSSHKKLPKSEAGLLTIFKQCCSKWDGFLAPSMPLMEIVFRLFLANGNKPLSLEQIQTKLQQQLTDTMGSRDMSIQKLKRIFDYDHFYGVRPTDGNAGAESTESNTLPQID